MASFVFGEPVRSPTPETWSDVVLGFILSTSSSMVLHGAVQAGMLQRTIQPSTNGIRSLDRLIATLRLTVEIPTSHAIR